MKALKLTKRRKIVFVIVLILPILMAYVGRSKIPPPPETVQNVTELDAYLE